MTQETERPHGSSRVVVLAVCTGSALTALDLTIVNVALPRIGADLDTGLSGLQWVVNAYTLAFASLILTAGGLADRLGDRAVFATGVGLFTAGSLGCGLAPDSGWLVGSRMVQGVGAAMILATSMSLLARTLSGSRRAAAITAWVTVGTLAANLGPIVGGVLVETLGWRAIFLVNVPIGLALLAVLLRITAPAPPAGAAARPLDRGGAVLAALTLFALHHAVVTGAATGWGAGPWTALGVAVAAGTGFVALQRRRGERALLDLRLFRIPTFSGAIVLSLLSRMASFGALPFFVLWFEGVVGLSPVATGGYLLALSLPVLAVALVSGRLQQLAPARTLIAAGNACALVGSLALLGVDAQAGPWTVVPGFVLLGLGAGLVFPSLMGLAVGVVDPARAGIASGTANTFFPLGTAVGVAGFGAVLTAAVDGAGLSAANRAAALTGVPVDPAELAAVAGAVESGLRVVAAGMAVLSAIAVVVALTTVRDTDRVPTARR
ncbi:MFS transporter [Pseudonocardia sp. NPDC049635]|uniref:MFS transporter n=1 Tax=Pseudonocardia sp. NPDC049635 TaxID=3155506 RepID=UPI0033EBCE53